MRPSFTAHNIVLDNGEQTRPGHPPVDQWSWFTTARDVLRAALPGRASQYRVADLGCLEGGFSVGFARLGYEVVGIEVRDSNIAACRYVTQHVNLPNLRLIQDDVRNLADHGEFDAVFCCGLLYHLDRPVTFIKALGRATRRVLIVQTHFANDEPSQIQKYNLSGVDVSEGAEGRWYPEFEENADLAQVQDAAQWSSWGNRRSFWLRREFLLQAIQDAGFDLVLEQFGPENIVQSLRAGYYRTDGRGTFIGLKVASP